MVATLGESRSILVLILSNRRAVLCVCVCFCVCEKEERIVECVDILCVVNEK